MKSGITRHFCLVPLRFSFSNMNGTILAITEHKKELVVSLNGLRLYNCQITNIGQKDMSISCGSKATRIDLKKEGYEIVKLGSINDLLLALFKKAGDNYGVLLSITQEYKVQVSTNVLCFDVNSPNITYSNSPIIAAIVGQEIRIFMYTSDVDKEGKTVCKWEKIYNDNRIQGVLAVSLSHPCIFAMNTQNAYYITTTKLQEDGDPAIEQHSLKFGENAFCMTYISPTYFAYSDKKAQIMSLEGKFKMRTFEFDDMHYEHARAEDIFASSSNSIISVYNFKKGWKSTIKFPGCKHVTSFNNEYFIATTDTEFYLVMECTKAINKINEGSLDEAIESIPNVNTDILAAIFEQLWQKDFKLNALSMLKYKEMAPVIYDIVCLFKMIKLVKVHSPIKYLKFSEQTEDQKLAKALIDNLLSIRGSKIFFDNQSESFNNRQNKSLRMIIDTTLFEIYAYQEDISNLAFFFNELPELLNDSIDAFFDGAETVSRAMYLAYIGNSKDSLAIFKKLENLDQVVLDQITRIIINTSSNWDFCTENLKWFFEVSPLDACKVLTSDSINSNNSLQFCREHFPDYQNIVLRGVLDHKDIYNHSDLVNEYARNIFELLLEINNESFDRGKVAFCKCVIENASTGTETPIEMIKEELGDDFIDVLRTFPKEIDINSPAFQTNQISSIPRVQVEIYRATGNVEKALRLLWDEKQKNPDGNDLKATVSVLEKFCKESEDSSSAFQILIKLLKEKLPNEQGMDVLMGILSRNMNMIDVPAALANINEDELVEKVAAFLEDTYRTLVTMRKDAELDAAFAESNEFESMYQRVRLESQSIEIRSDTICPKCKKPLNSLYLLRAPNGTLYHWKCIDSNNNP
ncbi:hypothetical protein M9Y10_014219 [Tritrichomonas musculus]|uniref:CNH domain-containing protein n=1 Tax=Tritrichomonas musculus TaxID=1915356 RepID=A0ABR2KYX3_9EUKA